MQEFVFLCYENIGQADIRNGSRGLTRFGKFSEGIKKPSGQDHTAAEGNYVIKASCRKKEARKTGIFLALKKECIRKQRWFWKIPEAVPARSLQTSEYSRRARDRRVPDEGKSNRRERKKRIPGSSAEMQLSD